MVKIIDGKKHADSIRQSLKERVNVMSQKPGFAVVLVGDRKDSATYVRMKERASEEIGIKFIKIVLPEDVTQDGLNEVIINLNNDNGIDGIIVQLPLPKHLNEEDVVHLISPEKDVDGMTVHNVGELCRRGGKPLSLPCTAVGCIELLKREGITISGKNAVVLGRSNIVGMPAAMLLNNENATVTICHSRTDRKSMFTHCLDADIIIAAVGIPNFLKADWLKPGVVIIDVGINPIPDETKKSGYRLVGDAEYDKIMRINQAGMITPVPGGVGPMTVAMLMNNVVNAAIRRKN